LHMAQLMPLPLTVSCFSKIQIGFTSLVPAHLGNPGQSPEGCKMDVYVLVLVSAIESHYKGHSVVRLRINVAKDEASGNFPLSEPV